MNENLETMRREKSGDEHAFTYHVRFKREWRHDLFVNLIRAMHQIARENERKEMIEKWLASSFYFCTSAIPRWACHPNFTKIFDEEYYQYAYEILDDLTNYLLTNNDRFQIFEDGIDEVVRRLTDCCGIEPDQIAIVK